MRFDSKVVVITGGANGIGKSIAQEFLNAGAIVSVIDIDPTPIKCNFYYQGDIADDKELEHYVNEVVRNFGKVDYLINNACISRKGILSNCNYQDFLYVLKVGVAAPYRMTQLLLDYFDPKGAIVNISSTRAFMSQPDTESYSAAKGGITALTHALAISLAGKVRVNSISPGWIDTTYSSSWSLEDSTQHPVKRIGTPEDIAKMTLFLCSENCGFITGENITIDGGMSKLMVYHNDVGWKYME